MPVRKRRKKKFNLFKIILLLIILGGIGFGGSYGINYYLYQMKDEPVVEVEPEPYVHEYKTTMVMVGDDLIHSSLYLDARTGKGYDFKPQITYVKKYLSDNNFDIAYYNQESILGGSKYGYSSYPTFNSPQEVGDAMIDAGFNLVSTSNNHTLDTGWRAVLSSREYWNKQEKNDVYMVGSYSSWDEKKKIETRVLESNGITYALLNYTYGTNGIPVPSGKGYLVNLWETDIDYINNPNTDKNYQKYKDTVKSDIEAIRDKVDVLMVAMHWGVEYTHKPTNYERDMAKFLADNGVDLIIGTHPHVIQPVEYIGDTLVFYSLGNFISAQYQNADTCTNYKCMVGLMSSLTITKKVVDDDVKITIDNVKNNLIYTYYTNWRKFKVIPFSDPDIKKYLGSYKKTYDTYAKIIASDDERIETVPLAE